MAHVFPEGRPFAWHRKHSTAPRCPAPNLCAHVLATPAGRSHGKATTFPRLADPLGFVKADDIFHAVKAVVAVQRDYGRRDDRKQVCPAS